MVYLNVDVLLDIDFRMMEYFVKVCYFKIFVLCKVIFIRFFFILMFFIVYNDNIMIYYVII